MKACVSMYSLTDTSHAISRHRVHPSKNVQIRFYTNQLQLLLCRFVYDIQNMYGLIMYDV